MNTFFECTNLREVTIPNSVTTIGLLAFAQCTCLTEVTIPNSVTRIGDSAFRQCTSLALLIFDNSIITTILDRTFNDCPAVTEPTNFVVPNARIENISFGSSNGDFSNLGTGGDGLQFGPENDPEPGFKTVTVVP